MVELPEPVSEVSAALARALYPLLLAVACQACERPSPARPSPGYPPAPGAPYPAQGQPAQPPPNAPPRSNDDISRVVNAAYPAFTACYMHSESFMTGKSGNVTIFFDIAPQGHVLRATDQPPPGIPVAGSPLRDARLTACLIQHFRQLSFSPARDETAASWLFSFAP